MPLTPALAPLTVANAPRGSEGCEKNNWLEALASDMALPSGKSRSLPFWRMNQNTSGYHVLSRSVGSGGIKVAWRPKG